MKDKRLVKNIIMIIILVLALGSVIFTIYLKNKNTTNNIPNVSNNSSSGNTPPNMNGGTPPGNSSDNSSSSSNTPPEKPANDNSNNNSTSNNNSNNNSSNNNSTNTPPEMPSGNTSNNGGTPPDMSSGNSSGGMPSTKSTSNIKYYVIFGIEGLIISLIAGYLIMSKLNKKSFKETFKDTDKLIIYILAVLLATGIITFGCNAINYSNNDTNNTNNTQMSGGTSQNVSYSANKEITSDKTIENEKYTSSTANENALLVSNWAKVTAKNITINKTGDSDGGDSTSFYGTNSGILAKDGANLTIEDANITTNATGANGVFSYGGSATTSNSSGDGTTVTIKNSTITTSKDNSGGIMTTGGGIMNAYNLKVTTAGTSSAAIRSDRGGGTVTVDKGTYKTTGQGSPTIYSTADITVKNATLTSTASEGVVIEGKNKVTLENVKLTDTNNKLNGKSTTYKNIFLYQSMSGDADTGESSFSAKDSDIITNKGDTFYITNTTASITLENNTITNNDEDGYFLRAQKDSWGTTGSNGGNVTLTLNNQKVTGDIYIDSISTLDMTIKDSSSYTGTINGENTAKKIKLTLSKNSKIKLTGDSYVSELDDADTDYSNIDFNGYKLYVNGKAIN